MVEGNPAANQVIWKAENDFPELCNALRDGMREIMDPEIGLNIIQLGLIRDVTIEPDNATVHMILTTPFCPYGPALIETARQKAEKILERPSYVSLGMEMWDFSMMEDGLSGEWGLY